MFEETWNIHNIIAEFTEVYILGHYDIANASTVLRKSCAFLPVRVAAYNVQGVSLYHCIEPLQLDR
jgi:hypothetical protein